MVMIIAETLNHQNLQTALKAQIQILRAQLIYRNEKVLILDILDKF